MGASFTNCNVRTTDTAKCAKVLKSSSGLPLRPRQRQTDWKEVVMILLEAGAQIPYPTKDGPIDVKTLSADRREKLADALLEAGAKIKLP